MNGSLCVEGCLPYHILLLRSRSAGGLFLNCTQAIDLQPLQKARNGRKSHWLRVTCMKLL